MSPLKCTVCSSQEVRFRYHLFDSEKLSWDRSVAIYACGKCKSFFSAISSDETRYDSDYYVFADHRKSADSGFARHCWQWLKAKNNVEGKTILDVGCGRGYFCNVAMHDGVTAIGIEPSSQVAEEARSHGCSVIVGAFEEVELTKNTFDILTMWDVLEHFNDPAICLKKANDLLKNGGLLAISVPNHSSFFAAIAGPYWKAYNLYHISHFSIQGLMALLQKTGFRIVLFDTYDNNLFSREGLYRLGIKDRIKAILMKLPFGQKLIINRRDNIPANREIITGHNDYVHGTERNILVKLLVKLVSRLRMGDQIRVLAEKI